MTTITQPKPGASLNRHRSKQDYSTPLDFWLAIEKRFGKPAWDLAASIENHKAPDWICEARDSLTVNWHELVDSATGKPGLLFLNPPFNNIAPWAEKCMRESLMGAEILFLTPASIGSNWFADFVYSHATVYALRPRLSFDGKNPYPKDCILAHFTAGGRRSSFECWKWK